MTAEIRTALFGGKRNPKQVLADALGESDKMEAVVVCAKYKDGIIRYAWSDGDLLTMIGLAALAVRDIANHEDDA
jgi:hypothetical protein